MVEKYKQNDENIHKLSEEPPRKEATKSDRSIL